MPDGGEGSSQQSVSDPTDTETKSAGLARCGYLFVAAIIAQFIVIKFAPDMKGSALWQWLVIAPFNLATELSAFCVVMYWVIGEYFLNQRSERFYNSVYYLGFMFTLVSLAMTLPTIGDKPDGASGDMLTKVAETLGNNAIALITTFFGLGIRIYKLQFRHDPEEAAELQLVSMMNDFQTALGRSGQLLEKEILKIGDKFGNSFNQLNEHVITAESRLNDQLHAYQKVYVTVLGQALEQNKEFLAALSATQKTTSDKIQETAEHQATVNQETWQAINGSLQGLKDKVEGLSEAMAVLHGQINSNETADAS